MNVLLQSIRLIHKHMENDIFLIEIDWYFLEAINGSLINYD